MQTLSSSVTFIRWVPFAFLAWSAVGAWAASEPVTPDHSFSGFIEQDSRFDNNVFNLAQTPTASQDGQTPRRDSYVFQTRAQLHYDLNLSRQHMFAETNVSNTDYQAFSALDYHGWQNSAGWDYALRDSLNGTLSYSDSRALAEMNNLALAQGDLQRTKASQGNIGFQLTPHVDLFGGFSHQAVTHNQLGYLDLAANSGLAGIAFQFDKGESLSFRIDTQRVAYDGTLSGIPATMRGFRQHTVQAVLSYPYSETLRLEASYGRSRLFQQLTEATVNNTVAAASVSWRVFPHILLAESFRRQYDAPGLDAALTLTRSLSSELTWQLSEKLDCSVTDTNSATQFSDLSVLGARSETTTNVRGSIEWKPLRKLSITLFSQRKMRRSPIRADVFSENQAGLNFQVRY